MINQINVCLKLYISPVALYFCYKTLDDKIKFSINNNSHDVKLNDIKYIN